PARVSLSVLADGEEWTFQRTGTFASSELEARRGNQIVDDASTSMGRVLGFSEPEQLAEATRTWGVLRQDALRLALQSGRTLHERLSAVVGLERVSLFADAASNAASELDGEARRLRSVQRDLEERRKRARVAAEQAT